MTKPALKTFFLYRYCITTLGNIAVDFSDKYEQKERYSIKVEIKMSAKLLKHFRLKNYVYRCSYIVFSFFMVTHSFLILLVKL